MKKKRKLILTKIEEDEETSMRIFIAHHQIDNIDYIRSLVQSLKERFMKIPDDDQSYQSMDLFIETFIREAGDLFIVLPYGRYNTYLSCKDAQRHNVVNNRDLAYILLHGVPDRAYALDTPISSIIDEISKRCKNGEI